MNHRNFRKVERRARTPETGGARASRERRFRGCAALLDERGRFSDLGDHAVGQGDVAHLGAIA